MIAALIFCRRFDGCDSLGLAQHLGDSDATKYESSAEIAIAIPCCDRSITPIPAMEPYNHIGEF